MALAPDAQQFVEVLRPAVRQAAAIARALEGRVPNTPKRGEVTDVKAALTLADTAAQEAVLVPLLEHFPWVSVEAEEDTDSVTAFAGNDPAARVVIDPIDGTLHSYLERRGPYACMVGLALRGRYEAALVALPREGLFFDAVRGGCAFRTRPRGEPHSWRAEASSGARVLVSHEMPEAVVARLEANGFAVSFACGGAISVAPLLPGVRAGLRWHADRISIRGRIGLVVARAGGAVVLDEHGDEFPDDVDSPARGLAVAADASDARVLVDALGAIPT